MRYKNPEMEDAVERAMCRGVPFTEIVNSCRAKWGVSPSTTARYCSDIRKRWAKEEEAQRPTRRAEFRALVMDAWRMCRDTQQGNALARLAMVLARFDGLEAPVQVAVNVDHRVAVLAMSPAERRTEIDRLIARRREALDGTAAGPLQLTTGGNGHGNGHGGNGKGTIQ